jgi:hypothetical protein
MLVTFKSKAAGDVMMFSDVAEQLLRIIGKAPGKGVLTPEQLPDAIARLKQAAAESKAQRVQNAAQEENAQKTDQRPFVSMAQRAVPLLELFERSLKANAPVTWGV